MYKIPIFALKELRTDTLLQYILSLHPELADKEVFPWVCETPWRWDTLVCDDPYCWVILFLLATTLQEYPYTNNNGVFSSEDELLTHVASKPWPYLTEEYKDAVFDCLLDGLDYAMYRAGLDLVRGSMVSRYNNYNEKQYPDEQYYRFWSIKIEKSTTRTKLLLLQIATASKSWEKALKEVWQDSENIWSQTLGLRVTRGCESIAEYVVRTMGHCALYDTSLTISKKAFPCALMNDEH